MPASISNIAVHLGPQLTGTIKETFPNAATTVGSMRNVGPGDAYQFGTLGFATTASTSSLTYTQTNAASPTGVVVLPAGAYIDNINIDVTVAFNAATNNTISVGLTPTSGVAGTTIFQIVGTAVTIPVGRWSLGVVGTGLVTWSGAGVNTAIPYWANVSNAQANPTDQIVTAWFTGTGTAATTGTAIIGIDYAVRNPDGSWYQQSPTSSGAIFTY